MAGGEADAVVALGRLVGQGLPAVLVTVVAVEGNPPSHPGAKLVFSGDRVVAGTLGCSEFDTAGAALAAELASAAVGHAGSCRPGARSGSPAALRRRAVFGHGGQQVLDMFAERFEPSPGAIVAGDNPVGRSVAELAGLIGWRIRLIEAPTDPVDDLTRQAPGPRDAVVVSDHDEPWAADVLKLALATDAFFVGMLGSSRHAPRVMDQLRAEGVPAERVADLRTPCGLDVGARTPAEIGLSIVAEMLAVERGRPGGSLRATIGRTSA